jgi:hypothetical protein
VLLDGCLNLVPVQVKQSVDPAAEQVAHVVSQLSHVLAAVFLN